MKRFLYTLSILLIIVSFAACAAEPAVTVTTPPSAAVIPSPTPSPSPLPSPTPSASAYKQLAEDTVIIANDDGYIIGGYSGGKWLSFTEAAAYCRQPMMFYCHQESETVQSSGARTEGGGYRLDIAESYPPYYLYYADPERFPKFEGDKWDQVKQAVQNRLDHHYGKGKAKANVIMGVSVDIDNDGKSEIIFNSNTVDEEESFNGVDSYSMSGVIEEDGAMHLTAEYYNTGDSEVIYLAWLQDVIDIDGDGVCEFVTKLCDFEKMTFNVYKYNGKEFTQVLGYEKSFSL